MTEPLTPSPEQPGGAPPNGHPAAQPLDLHHEHAQQAILLEQKLEAERAAQYLRLLSQRMRAFLQHSADGVVIFDGQHRVVEVSEQFCRVLGYRREELMDQGSELWDVGLGDAARQALRQQLQDAPGQRLEFESQHRRKDGSVFAAVVAVVRFEHDGQTYTFASVQDISQRKEQAAALQQALRLTEEVLEGQATAVAVLSRERVVLRCNTKYAALFGLSAQQLLGRCVSELEPPEITAHRQPYIDAVLRGETVRFEDSVIDAQGQQLRLKITNTPRFDAQGQVIGYITSGDDVTELVLAREQAHGAERAKQQFLATISHELRTPLNGVLGGLQILQRMPLPARASKILQASSESGKLLLSIINDVLDFSKIDSGKIDLHPEPIRLCDTFAAMQEMLNTLPRKPGVVLHFECAPALDQLVLVDDLRLRQIITNLTSNALKFTLRGRVRVAANLLGHKNERLQVQLQVQDSGIGMNREMLDKLFTPFSQADGSHTRQFGGTGLGLSIVKRLVDAMGGEVFVSSQVGTGSLFSVLLPLPLAKSRKVDETLAVAITRRLMSGLTRSETLASIQASNMAASPTPAPEAPQAMQETPAALEPPDQKLAPSTPADNFGPFAKSPPQRAPEEQDQDELEERTDDSSDKPLVGLRVLVADDAPINRLVASTFLEEFGAQVFEAEHGEQALRKLRDEGLQVDLVLMDMQMPIMDGMEATRQIRRVDSLRKLKIVAMTGNITQEDRQACIDAGMNGYLSKPLTIPALLEAVTT